MLIEVQGQAQLGADAVGARDQHRLLVAGRDFAEGAEAAQAAHDFRPFGALGHALDAFDQGFARIDIDAGVLVADGRLLAHRSRPFERDVRGATGWA